MGRRTDSSYFRRAWAAVSLFFYTFKELVVANVRVAWWTVSSLASLKPAVMGIPMKEGMTDGEITLLSTLITLTPGTLTLDVSDDRLTLFVHFMHVDDETEAIKSITEGFERRILEVTR